MKKIIFITILMLPIFSYTEDLYQRKGFNYWEITYDLSEANKYERQKEFKLADEAIRNSFTGPAEEYIKFLLNERRFLRSATPTWLVETEIELKEKIIESIKNDSFSIDMLPPSISFSVLETDWTGLISRYDLVEYFNKIIEAGITYEYINHKEIGSYFIFFIKNPPTYNDFFNEWKTVIVNLDYINDSVFESHNNKYALLTVQFDSYLV